MLEGFLRSEEWPVAVVETQVADEKSESDKVERAEGIAGVLLPPMADKKFLDYGCGEGHVAICAARSAAVSVGYDIQKCGIHAWEEKSTNLLLTNEFDKVALEGPYDYILLYDVVDHAIDPVQVLSLAKSVLKEGGSIYMRCHPWCGRHGGHLYRAFNKAFVHLVFTEEEFQKLGFDVEYNSKVTLPLDSYDSIISKAGLRPEFEPTVEHQEVESFFRESSLIASRILAHWGRSHWDHCPPEFQMSMCFLDYVLKKA
jgi:SAM-dependent methyltransferase